LILFSIDLDLLLLALFLSS